METTLNLALALVTNHPYAVQIAGDVLAPDLKHGEYAIVDPAPDAVADAQAGAVVLAVCTDSTAPAGAIARLMRLNGDGDLIGGRLSYHAGSFHILGIVTGTATAAAE